MNVPIEYAIYLGVAGILVASLFWWALVPALNRRAIRRTLHPRQARDYPPLTELSGASEAYFTRDIDLRDRPTLRSH